MTKQEMIAKVEQQHRSRPGYNFDPAKVAEIITAGTIPEGTILNTRADQTAKVEGDKVRVYINGQVSKEMALEGAILENCLMQYAYNESKLGTSMGRI